MGSRTRRVFVHGSFAMVGYRYCLQRLRASADYTHLLLYTLAGTQIDRRKTDFGRKSFRKTVRN